MSRLLDVLLVTADRPYDDIGGIAAHVRGLSEAMARSPRVDRVSVLSLAPGGVGPATQGVEVGLLDLDLVGLDGIRRWGQRRRAVSSAVADWLGGSGSSGAAVVHSHDLLVSTAGIASGARDAAWVWTNHSSGFLMNVDRRSYRWRTRIEYRRADAVIAPSQELAQESRRVIGPGTPIRYIPNGVDISRYEPVPTQLRSRGSALRIFSPRRIVWKNGVDVLVEAVALLASSGVAFELRLAGSGASASSDDLATVRMLTQSNGVENRVRFLGDLRPVQMREEFAAASAVVLPSRMEAVSIAALEAMSMGSTVVASDVGGLSQLIDDQRNGLLVPADDPQSLAAALRRIADHPALAEQLGEGARRTVVAGYSWDAVADQTLDLYESVLR